MLKSTKTTSKQTRTAYCTKVNFRAFLHDIDNRKLEVRVFNGFLLTTLEIL